MSYRNVVMIHVMFELFRICPEVEIFWFGKVVEGLLVLRLLSSLEDGTLPVVELLNDSV